MKTVPAFCIRLALPLSMMATGISVQAQDNTRNYVLTRTHKNNGQSPDAQYSVDQVHMALTYFDGLGRPQQALSVQTAPDKKDLVAPTEYDDLGRVKRAWLPAPTGNQNAAFQGDATTKAEIYYNNASRFDDPSTQAYTQTDYESNLLSRVSQTRAPATGNTVRRSYGVNGDNEVRRYDAGGGLTDISSPGNYPSKTLTVTTTKDEQDYELSEFADRDGRVVLRRTGKNGQYANTYYVYDELSQLRAVLQPQFQSNADLNKYAFLYRYDGQGRVVEKRVPGSNNVSMEYDGRDRLVASTDGRGQKFYYHYDELNRQTEMGLCNNCDPYNPGNGGGKQFLVRTQYDKYDNLPGFEGNDNDLIGGYFTHNNQVQGQVTGQWVRLLQDNGNLGSELQSVNFYDSKYRLVQTRRQLNLGSNGWERTSYQRDFLGKVLKERTTQSWSGQSQSWEKTYTYDHADRLISTTARVSGGGLPERTITLSALSYNEVGQLTGRKLHATDAFGSGAKASLGYKYNVRGWLRGVTNSPQSFGLSLNYQPNGNVSYMGWQHPGSGGNYGFEYDELNRLKKGRRDGSGGMGEELTYDANGNILTLKRYNGGGGMIDDLGYSYDGNQLKKVTDGTGNGEGFNNGGSGNNDDYNYDGAGNLTSDANRGANLSYNVLNLPRQISLNGKTLRYTYDGTGSKRTLSVEGSGVVTTYEGTFEYDGSGSLKRIATDEGQLISNGGNWQWQYYLKDHLGNVRVVLDENGNAIQQTEYQPFGLAMPVQPGGSVAQSAGVNKYFYNGKEWQPETGYLDYGARQYDAAVGRWFNVDPLAEVSRRWSPFVFAYDSPARFVDPDGMEVTYDVSGTHYSGEDAVAYFRHLQIAESNEDDDKKDKNKKGNHGNASFTDKQGKVHRFYMPAMDVTVNMSEKSKEIYNKEALKQTLIAAFPWGKLLGWLGRSIGLTAGAASTSVGLAEAAVVKEAAQILKSSDKLYGAFNSGVGTELSIAGRTIIVEPEASISGMTLFEEKAFVIGREAFASKPELVKTILHELYRLHTSTVGATGSASQAAVSQETAAAASFAERHFSLFVK